MPSKKQYDLVQNDDFDTRIPLHPEEAFRHGITFQAKYIGMLDVPRPTSRVEIVAAMRRIRYEFKTKGVKKKKVTIEVSVDGVKVTLRKKKKRKQWLEEGKSVLLSHPIYRIFYVSHDSQDLKIFSYIARDGASNVFKCAVFKSNKKSQAMRIVRTVGQAFEVCHKMAITAPENDQDYDDQDTCTQDDRLSDLTTDKPKRDITLEGASDKVSLPDDNATNKDLNGIEGNRQYQLDLLSVPAHNTSSNNTSGNNSANNTLANSNNNSNNNSNVNLFQRKSPMENYPNTHGDLLGGGGNLPSTIGSSGNTISAQHEIQLLREQLDQQSQQTQAAMAQLQLAREQLAAEQSARMEAQSRTHQLLVHNRELLDHIAALVAHLQGGEKVSNQQQNSPHVTMPQQSFQGMNNSPEHQDHSQLDHTVLQALGLNPQDLIENPMVTSRLPSSPLRSSFNAQSNLFNFPMQDFSLEAQLLQRLQALCGYTPPQYNYMNQPLPFLSNLYGQGMVNNNYTLQPPPQKRLPPSPLAVRHSYSTSPIMDNRISPTKNDSLQNIHQVYQSQQSLQNPSYCNQNYQSNQSLNQIPQQNSQHLQVQGPTHQRQSPQRNLSPKTERSSEPQFIKPLSQMGTLTTTDTDGRVRVIVPVPSADEASGMMSQMRLDDYRPNVPSITRSTSEKVPNRSELMSQVQRTAWARHTTK